MRLRTFAVLLLGASSLAAASLTPEQHHQDLNYIVTQLPKLHVNFFFQLNPADFYAAVNALDAQAATLSDTQFYVQLATLVAMAGDPHTHLYLGGQAAAAMGFQQFPLLFRWFDDGVFAFRRGLRSCRTCR